MKYIFVCTGKSCKKTGSKKLAKLLKSEIRNAGLGKSVRVIATKCMDQCKTSPNLIKDNILYKRVSEDQASDLLWIEEKAKEKAESH